MRLGVVVFFIFFCAMASRGFSQSPPDSTSSVSSGPSASYTYEVDFGTNTSFKGVSQNSSQYYYSPNFTYAAPKGFYLYTAVYHLNGLNNPWDELDISAGYDFKIRPKLTGSVSYMHSSFKSDSPLINSGLNNDIQLYIRRKFAWINTKLIFDYYFGQERDYTLTLSLYKRISLHEVFSRKDEIAITPKFKVVGGTENFYYSKNPAKSVYRFTKTAHLPFSKTNPHTGKRYTVIASSSQQTQQSQTEAATTETLTEYGIISYVFTVPLSYTYGKFTIEPSWNYSLPGNLTVRPALTYYALSVYMMW